MNQAYGDTRLARRLVRLSMIASGVVFMLAGCTLCSSTANLLWLVLLILASDVGVLCYTLKQGLFFELLLERKWRHVCSGLGGNFIGEGPSVLRSVRAGLASRGRYVPTQTKIIYPKLRDVHGNREAWTATVIPFAGQTVAEYNQHIEAFTLAFNVPYVAFEPTDTGVIQMRCGPVQVPEAYEYEQPQLAAPAATDVRATLQAVPMARDINYQPWYLPIEGNHVLIVGRTGSGKSNWIWSLVFGLAPARQAGLVRLWGLDPKRLELAYGMQWWDEYADTTEGMVELLEKAVADMLERNKTLQGKARKFTPSLETPLVVIIIDELAYLSAATDKRLQQRAQTAMRTILWLGRAAGYSLVGCSQDPRKEVLDERDYYPTKVALGMEASMVDLLLGKGAHDQAGAYAEQLPLREAGAGCAYVKDELSSKAVLVRSAWCSDDAIRRTLDADDVVGGERLSLNYSWPD